MREIEIKVKVDSLQVIIDRLTSQGVSVSDPVTQYDRVYGQPGIVGDDENTAPWLRIRTETKGGTTKNIFTLKRSVTNQMDSIEHETEIADDVELEKIITQLSFVPYTKLTKTRQKAKLTDIEICLDTVDGLGMFIEAEKLTADDVDYQSVIDELWIILETLGLSRADEVTDGYDVLMNRHLETIVSA
jgi:adenylate cyclase class 2